jgi:hypothetical protein
LANEGEYVPELVKNEYCNNNTNQVHGKEQQAEGFEGDSQVIHKEINHSDEHSPAIIAEEIGG